jgi:hypothetical protein
MVCTMAPPKAAGTKVGRCESLGEALAALSLLRVASL